MTQKELDQLKELERLLHRKFEQLNGRRLETFDELRDWLLSEDLSELSERDTRPS
jgi:hypothetical protein